jgi:hypothetical protein
MMAEACAKEKEELFDALDHLNRLAIAVGKAAKPAMDADYAAAKERYARARAALEACEGMPVAG